MSEDQFILTLRQAAPYVHQHRGRCFVVAVSGEAALRDDFNLLIHDLALLHGLGVRLVVVHGARPQINAALDTAGIETQIPNGLRVTERAALPHIKSAIGALRSDIEAMLSSGFASSASGGKALHVVGGNLLTARPLGVHNGIDYGFTGVPRRVDDKAIQAQLDLENLLLISPLAHSPSGDSFNLGYQDIACAVATALRADKLIFIDDESSQAGNEQHDLPSAEALLGTEKATDTLQAAVLACRNGVPRAHLIGLDQSGQLLKELYSRDGAGTLIYADHYDNLRTATPEDIGAIQALIGPLEAAGMLVPRSHEQLESDIEHFTVMTRDDLVIACNALVPYEEDNMAEFACVATHADYQKQGRASTLLQRAEKQARAQGIQTLFALTTQAPDWFIEHGFSLSDVEALPNPKRWAYCLARNAKVLTKPL